MNQLIDELSELYKQRSKNIMDLATNRPRKSLQASDSNINLYPVNFEKESSARTNTSSLDEHLSDDDNSNINLDSIIKEFERVKKQKDDLDSKCKEDLKRKIDFDCSKEIYQRRHLKQSKTIQNSLRNHPNDKICNFCLSHQKNLQKFIF